MNNACPILLMEDDANDALLFKRALTKLGMPNPIQLVRDGEEGIAYLSGTGRYADRRLFPIPCFIITDLNMPRRSGLEVLEWLGQHQEFRIVPTLVLSSSTHGGDISKAYHLGANSYMLKPTDFRDLEKLVATIRRYWEACEKPRAPSTGAGT